MTSNKRRPAIVISNDEYNHKTQDAIVVGVTSNIQRKEYSVLLRKESMEEGELLQESEIRADKIYSISQGIIVKRFGRIKEDVFREVVKKIDALIEARGV
ncbi:MAG: type II toxin-antitoxin system PemK/MazF family toxin [Methanobacteriota archaeon]